MSARRWPVRGNRDAGAAVLEDDDDSGDVVMVDYRFSILAVRRFVDQLSVEQEEVVRSIGFEGVLHLTRYNKLDRHFSAWLCNQLELVTAAAAPGASSSAPVPLILVDGAGEKVPVTARNVHEVLGIPNGERRVGLGRNSTEKEIDAAAVRRALGLDPGEAPTLQLAEAVIARRRKDAPSPGPMTQPERDAFVVAFLLLLVEHFFAPGPVGRRGKVNEEAFHAVANPSEVHLYDWAEYVLDEFYDWAEYVLDEFRRCAGSVRRQVTSRCSRISLSGCLLFLQIFYLDRLDLETTNCEVPRDVLPRVAAYEYSSIYNAINLDRQPEWPEGGLKLFGKLKLAVKRTEQTNDFGSTSKGTQPYLHSCDSEQHDSAKNTDMLPILQAIEQYVKCHGIEHLSRTLSKMDCSGLHNKLNKGEKHQPLAHDQHLPDAAEGTDTVNVRSYSGNTAPWVQAELKTKEILNNLQPVTQQGVPSKKRRRSHFCDMVKEASPSTEKKPTVQVTSCQTNPESTEDVIILDRNPFVSSTLGSCPANPAPWSGHVEAFANLKPRITQEVPLERTSPLELPDRNGAQCELHPDMILGASPSSEAEKKPAVQATLCQTNSDGADDVVILDKPFQSRTAGSTANSASRVQSRSNPKEIFTNQRPKTQQEVASEKKSQSEFLIREEKKPVVQMSSCQTTSDSSEDVEILDTHPFESRTVSFHPKNAAPRAQSRSNPKDVFSNLHPRTKQEVPSEKISQTEVEIRKVTQCGTYRNKLPAASSCPEEKSVTQETPCQTTPEDVMILDSNPFESNAACTPSCRGPEMNKEYIFGRSPFEMGLVHPKPPLKQAEACFKWLEACSYQDDQLNWTWVILEEPNSIAVDGLHIKLEMIRGAALKQDVCNLAMRLYRQLDDETYQNSGNAEPRWRHFLPAEWSLSSSILMMITCNRSSALEHGDKMCELSAVRSMFTGTHIAYDVGLCRMVIAPVELDGSWSCYAWDFMEKRLNILDPLLRRSRSGRKLEAIKMKRASSAPQLLSALLVCVSLYCNSHGYDHQQSSPNSWKKDILRDFKGMRSLCELNTGMYTLFYARKFDGKGLKQTVSQRERTIESFRRDLLHQMLTMRGNTGRPPSIVDYPATGPI